MPNEYQEVINQLGNLITSLGSFSDRDSDLVKDDKLKKEFVRQQRASNKLAFDLTQLKDSLEAESSFTGEGSLDVPSAKDSAARFASERVLNAFIGKLDHKG